MLAGLLLGFVHDRRLMREAQVNLAIRWFIGYGLEEELPDHSSLTRIRQRWGEERFREIFRRTVPACLDGEGGQGRSRARGRFVDTCERELGESGGGVRDEVIAGDPLEEEYAQSAPLSRSLSSQAQWHLLAVLPQRR